MDVRAIVETIGPLVAVAVVGIVAGVAHAVAIAVGLIGVGRVRAVVQAIGPLVAVAVVGVVAAVPHAIAIAILLARVLDSGAVVAGFAHAIGFAQLTCRPAVELLGVVGKGAVVGVEGDSVVVADEHRAAPGKGGGARHAAH